MDKEEALKRVRPHLTESRFEHTKRVVNTAVELGRRFGGNQKQIELAGAFHDYAKYRGKEELKQCIMEHDLPGDMLSYHHELWHGPVGSVLVQQEQGIEDTQILSAIEWHTTGHAGMTKLEKIIFLADYMEPGRNFPGVEEVRKAAEKDLEEACFLASKNTISYLVSRDMLVYPETVHAYNGLQKELTLKWRDERNG